VAKKVTGVMSLAAFGATDIGRRRDLNEDAYCVEPGLGLLAVADGLGGHPAGEVASSLAISLLRHHLLARLSNDDHANALDLMAEAVEAGNAAIRERMAVNPQYRGMATTLTACLVKGGCAHFTHIGDSRAYLLRDGRIAQLTEDHTAAALRQRQGRGGAPARGNASNQRLLSALGMSSWAGMDLFVQNLRIGDMLLLCTDGLTGELSEDELASTCQLPLSLPARVERFLSLANERGGSDNITAILATFQESV
jgi:protein phosphatase